MTTPTVKIEVITSINDDFFMEVKSGDITLKAMVETVTGQNFGGLKVIGHAEKLISMVESAPTFAAEKDLVGIKLATGTVVSLAKLVLLAKERKEIEEKIATWKIALAGNSGTAGGGNSVDWSKLRKPIAATTNNG